MLHFVFIALVNDLKGCCDLLNGTISNLRIRTQIFVLYNKVKKQTQGKYTHG